MKHGSMEMTPLPAGSDKNAGVNACPLPQLPDLTGVAVVALHPHPSPADYLAAMPLAQAKAQARLGECMLLSWYDRDFEAPQHMSECHQDNAVPGYVDYAIRRGAQLMIDIESGRFVFFYRPVDL